MTPSLELANQSTECNTAVTTLKSDADPFAWVRHQIYMEVFVGFIFHILIKIDLCLLWKPKEILNYKNMCKN